MTTAFQAVYTNFKPIPSRGVVQIVLEAPIEAGDSIIAMLGMPTPAGSKWVGVARIVEQKQNAPEETPCLAQDEPPSGTAAAGVEQQRLPDAASKKWTDMSYSQRAGILCGEPKFLEFLINDYKSVVTSIVDTQPGLKDPELCAAVLRALCKVASRRVLNYDGSAQGTFDNITKQYRLYLKYGQ